MLRKISFFRSLTQVHPNLISTRKAKPDQFTKKVTAFNQRGSLRSNLVNLEIEIERGPVTSILEEEYLFPKEDS